ncbi:hypothetical protein [Photobacterium carnosum]|uniref:hypothetical protein n=1 Tax=Photobacterium carnosum TaxID=2023717 RepID=UPI001E2C85B5|nr:hypothetical protein [Photobacterium carnosum]MCD9538953.1 hypothetical protein [Photobacterium carnosum]MCF2163693.1 hypothetical protein [Photobacterium carnosum]MCF2307809.1 hypothetical protein [Photobacterium carnosum]
MNNNIIKLICLVLSVATACLSATLTTKFMFSIGQDMGSPVLMAALGLLLDLAKCATPLFVLFLWSQKMRLASVFALVLSMTLSAVSFSASVAALESGVVANAQNSVSYQRIESQMTDYRDQVVELRQLAKRQQDVKQITKSQNTLSQIPTLLTRIDELSNQQANFSGGESVVSKYGMMISYVTALALELLSWLFVCVSFALNKVKHSRSQLGTVVHRQQNMSVQPIDLTTEHSQTHTQSFTLDTQLNAVNDTCFASECDQCVFECSNEPLKAKCDSQLYFDIRDAILAKGVKPSFRGVTQQFKGVSRGLIANVLADLHETGFLKNYRKGYAFA